MMRDYFLVGLETGSLQALARIDAGEMYYDSLFGVTPCR
jgi:hypothetical protein